MDVQELRLSAGTHGFIIVAVDKHGTWRYFNGTRFSWQFGDETRPEKPLVYKQEARARKRCQQLANQDQLSRMVLGLLNAEPQVAYWVHPEADFKSLEYYIKMAGGQLPSSPSQ